MDHNPLTPTEEKPEHVDAFSLRGLKRLPLRFADLGASVAPARQEPRR
jgi:hypothetical protein